MVDTPIPPETDETAVLLENIFEGKYFKKRI